MSQWPAKSPLFDARERLLDAAALSESSSDGKLEDVTVASYLPLRVIREMVTAGTLPSSTDLRDAALLALGKVNGCETQGPNHEGIVKHVNDALAILNAHPDTEQPDDEE